MKVTTIRENFENLDELMKMEMEIEGNGRRAQSVVGTSKAEIWRESHPCLQNKKLKSGFHASRELRVIWCIWDKVCLLAAMTLERLVGITL